MPPDKNVVGSIPVGCCFFLLTLRLNSTILLLPFFLFSIIYDCNYNGESKENIFRWCCGRPVANKLSIYFLKCPFSHNLMFGTAGSPEQEENFMSKHPNLCNMLSKSINAFGSVFKMVKRFLQL